MSTSIRSCLFVEIHSLKQISGLLSLIRYLLKHWPQNFHKINLMRLENLTLLTLALKAMKLLTFSLEWILQNFMYKIRSPSKSIWSLHALATVFGCVMGGPINKGCIVHNLINHPNSVVRDKKVSIIASLMEKPLQYTNKIRKRNSHSRQWKTVKTTAQYFHWQQCFFFKFRKV